MGKKEAAEATYKAAVQLLRMKRYLMDAVYELAKDPYRQGEIAAIIGTLDGLQLQLANFGEFTLNGQRIVTDLKHSFPKR